MLDCQYPLPIFPSTEAPVSRKAISLLQVLQGVAVIYGPGPQRLPSRVLFVDTQARLLSRSCTSCEINISRHDHGLAVDIVGTQGV